MRKILSWILAMLISQEGFAKLRNNPLGDPMGKFGNCVGGKWKNGFYWIRARVFPAQRGTIKDYQAFKAGTLRRMSFKQMNIHKAIIPVLGYLGRMNLVKWIDVIFEDYIMRHGITNLSGLNLMVKENASLLWNSIPNKDQEYNETTNAPDLKVMQVSKGDLEALTSFEAATYNPGTGVLSLTWGNTHFTNGLDTDKVYCMVAKKPILNTATWKPTLFMYTPTDTTKTRVDGSGTVTLPAGLTAADLVAFIFAKDVANTYGYSASLSRQVA